MNKKFNTAIKSFSYAFRCSYNPYDGPNEHPEAELPLVAGKYLYVYGTMDEDGFYEGLTCLGIVYTFCPSFHHITSHLLFVSQESCWMDSGDSSHPILWILSKMRRHPLSNTGT